MRTIQSIAFLALLCSAPVAAQSLPGPGIWTNTEDEYFAEEEGREKPEWVALEINGAQQWRSIDAFGEPQAEWQDGDIAGLTPNGEGWELEGSELRMARPFACWVSVKKFAGKPDGGEDWTFDIGLPVFDQGGRIFVGGKGEAPDVTLRMRNVTWSKGSRNKPSLVIYMHKDDLVRAESYSWASPDSTLIGINLRWVQASCSPVTEDEQ